MNPFLLAVEGGNFEVPSPVNELFEFPAFLFKDSAFLAFNRTTLLMLLSAVIISAVLIIALRGASVIPGKLQAVVEAIFEFIREEIVQPTMGAEGMRFIPLLASIFLFTWINNLYEVLPLVNFPTTSRMAIPAFLAIMVWMLFIAVGVKEQGGVYFKNAIIPSGVPVAILFLVIPIELVSTFIVRPLTLAVRLFANMMAGHIILVIIFVAANAFLFDVTGGGFNLKGSPIGIVALAFGPALVAFEMLVGILQAYIFTILAAVYIGSSMHADH